MEAEDKQVTGKYFGICPLCGEAEWFELYEYSARYGFSKDAKAVINSLKPNGDIVHVNEYSRSNAKATDNICLHCECPVVLVPFDFCSADERIELYKMCGSDRIEFAEKFKLADSLSDESEE